MTRHPSTPKSRRTAIRAPRVAATLLLTLLPFRGGAEERIIAAAPHIVETLFAIGAGDQIVGTVNFADYPPEAKAIPQVGSYKAISVEPALRLEPTLVLAMNESVGGLDRLEALGVPVLYSFPKTVEGVLEDIVRLGKLVGRSQAAAEVSRSLRTRLERLRQRRPPPPGLRVFYEIWHEPLISAGEGSFISNALEEIGVDNVFKSVPIEGPRVNVEAVLRAAPEAIIIPGESRDVGERMRFWRRWFDDEEGVLMVEAAHDLLHRPGPRLIDGMERLQADLQRAAAARSAEKEP